MQGQHNVQTYQELRSMLTQLTQRLGVQPDTQSSQQQTPAVIHQRSLSPVKNRKRMRNLSPMSQGFKKRYM